MKIIIPFVMAIVLLGFSYYAQEKSTLLQWISLVGAGLCLAYLFKNRPRAASEEQKSQIAQKIINKRT